MANHGSDVRHALVTGGAGFIGSHLADHLLVEGWRVTVVDNFDPFYPREIKTNNLRRALGSPAFQLFEEDIRDADTLDRHLTDRYDVIVHLAALAGVRPSIAEPVRYQDVNVRGTQVLLEFARKRGIKQFVFASSSSVYGVNPNVPWSEEDTGLRPISPYASSKVSGELLGHVYSHLYGIRFIALRFFTVYGPRQRPDLAIHKFARAMLADEPVTLFGNGGTRRDYTYVGDVVRGIRAAMTYDKSMYEVINLGNNRTVSLSDLVDALSFALGVSPRIDWQPEQPGDVPQTWASIEKARTLLGYSPDTPLETGLAAFARWLRDGENG